MCQALCWGYRDEVSASNCPQGVWRGNRHLHKQLFYQEKVQEGQPQRAGWAQRAGSPLWGPGVLTFSNKSRTLTRSAHLSHADDLPVFGNGALCFEIVLSVEEKSTHLLQLW